MFAEKIVVLSDLYLTGDFNEIAESDDIISFFDLPEPIIKKGEVLSIKEKVAPYTVYHTESMIDRVKGECVYLTEKSYSHWISRGIIKEN